MKIIYIHQYFKTPMEAGGTRSYEMAKRLVEYGHDVHIVTSSTVKTGNGWSVNNIDGINIHSLSVPYNNNMGFGRRIRAFLVFALLASVKSKRLGGDLVFATSTPLTVGIPALWASKLNKIPLVFEVRDQWPAVPIEMGVLKNPVLKKIALWFERYIYKNSKKMIALSPGMKRGMVLAGADESDVVVIPNSSDLELFSPNANSSRMAGGFFEAFNLENDGRPVVLYPGTLGKVNGVGFLVDLAKVALDDAAPIRFVIIGDGVERDMIMRRASDLGVLEKTLFVFGKIPKAELVAAFHAASLIASTVVDIKILEDNSANKFFDALASGTPLVINYGGWQKDILERNNAGLSVSRDPALAYKELKEFLFDADRYRSACAAALILAEKKFSRDILASQLNQVLLETKA